ncbi:MAG TPA: DUF3846 domain-containing protein [Gallicola sp.]|nr:DUF3846 domain-containing protein [Gallicola sp.]
MKKIELATKLVDFFEEFDHYNFKDNMQGDREDEIYRISSSFFNIEVLEQMIIQLAKFSKQAKGENKKEHLKLEEIIEDLKNYKLENSLNVLVLEPDKKPYQKVIINDYEAIEREINGNVSVHHYKNNYSIYCDDNGFDKKLEPNRYINDSLIVGKFLIISHDQNGRKSLTSDEISTLSIELKDYILKEDYEIENGGKNIC